MIPRLEYTRFKLGNCRLYVPKLYLFQITMRTAALSDGVIHSGCRPDHLLLCITSS